MLSQGLFMCFVLVRFGKQTKNFRLYYDGMHYVGKIHVLHSVLELKPVLLKIEC